MASTLTTTASSTAFIQGAGEFTIFNSTSSTAASLWYRVHPNVRNVGVAAKMTGSSAGATVTGAFEVQASMDGVTKLATLLGTISLSGGSPQADGLAIDTHWPYLRVVMSSGTTGSSGTTVDVSAVSLLPYSG